MKEKLYLLDLSLWKRSFIRNFFPDWECVFTSRQKFARLAQKTLATGEHLTAAFWASHLKNEENRRCCLELKENPHIRLIFLEDAFIRSLGLGCDFFYPYSIARDETGIYYDPSEPSTLELLITGIRERPDHQELLERARKIRKIIVDGHISKYYRCPDQDFQRHVGELRELISRKDPGKPGPGQILFVPCQVDTDASVITGGLGYDSLSLVRELREKNPDACIIAKVHPDVLQGKRRNSTAADDYGRYASLVFTSEFSSLECIEVADEVHTISSYSGFEALMRGRKVVCYGMPFYAGYGLTEDVSAEEGEPVAVNTRRRRFNSELTVDDIWAATAILYPVYYNWDRKALSTPEEVATVMATSDKTKQSRFFQIRSRILAAVFFKPYNWLTKRKVY